MTALPKVTSFITPRAIGLSRIADVLEHLGLAVLIGGMLALGAFVAPTLFHHLPLQQAGQMMTMIFRRYDMVILAGILMLVAGECLRLLVLGLPTFIIARLRLLLVMLLTGIAVFSLWRLHPQLEAYQRQGVTRGIGIAGQQFDRMHRQSETLYKTQMLLAVLVLLFLVCPQRKSSKPT